MIKKTVPCGAVFFICRLTALLFAASAALWANQAHSAQPAQALSAVRVFAVYEPVCSKQDVEILSRVHPDFVCRGWFKWHNTPDWQAYAPLAQACRDKGILLQGGITLAALYPGENGMDYSTFRDFACHGTDGQPYLFGPSDGSGWYHLSLYNPKVVEYLKREVRLQIDAGAVGIWYDEIEGYYDWNPTEGYDTYACAAFREWLICKYCVGQGWREDDPRWQTQFGIDLSKHKGSIRTFDYLLHLQTTPGNGAKPLAANPPQGNPRLWASSANPLYREWGYAWSRKAQGTFRFDTVAAIFADILADADRYAREKYGRTLLSTYNHNGTARQGVAFQQPHNGTQPPLRKGRLDGHVSYLPYYEGLIADAAEVCPGQPVVFFVDWPGETDRLTAMTRADQTHFFSLYIPEAYAAGGEFALPLRGYSYAAARQETLGTLARMADFYREYAPWLRGSCPQSNPPQTPERLTIRVRSTASGTTVHLVNHAFSTSDVWPLPRTHLTVTLSWVGPVPSTAFAVSPDFPEQRPVPLTLKNSQLTLEVGTVTSSALVILPSAPALRSLSGCAATGTHILDTTGRALAVAQDNRFTLWLPQSDVMLECLETGERLTARNGVAFASPPGGAFASGLLLDAFGIPARHAEIAGGTRRWHTDGWGRFRVPLAWTPDNRISACVVNNATNTITLNTGFTAWRFFDARRSVGDFSSSLDGYWPNWPNKDRTPGVITLAQEEHLGRSAMRCLFSPVPRVSWQNINSPDFEFCDAGAVELVYAGDGTPRTVNAVIFATHAQNQRRFYRFPLSLATKEWTSKRIALGEFRDDHGIAFNPSSVTGNASLQFSPSQMGDTSATFWVHSASLLNGTPARELWRSAADFDLADVDNLRAGHQPQTPPPVPTARQPLIRFNGALPRLLANWEGKGPADRKPMVAIERIVAANQTPFLRVTLPAGECAWGNANITLPAAQLQGQSGLVLRLRVKPAAESVALALHVMAPHKSEFFTADCEVGEEWSELVLPWSQFRRSDGLPFQPASGTSINLQICRPPSPLSQDCVIDIEQLDVFALSQVAPASELPDLRTVAPDLTVPVMTTNIPAAGRRVRMTLASYRGTEVYHALYLPTDWQEGKRFPVIIEYAGNGSYSNRFGDVCDGQVESSKLGYGASGGKGFIWVCAPFISQDRTRNQPTWWGDVDATASYCTGVVAEVCAAYGGDPSAVFLAGFSRGSIACNYIGLHNDAIASLWRGFLCHSHYDGVRKWSYADSDRAAAAVRLGRLRGRPQFISQERSTGETQTYLTNTCPVGHYTYVPIPYRNHTDAWTLRDIPARAALRLWLAEALKEAQP
jgi:hypothetical protein